MMEIIYKTKSPVKIEAWQDAFGWLSKSIIADDENTIHIVAEDEKAIAIVSRVKSDTTELWTLEKI